MHQGMLQFTSGSLMKMNYLLVMSVCVLCMYGTCDCGSMVHWPLLYFLSSQFSCLLMSIKEFLSNAFYFASLSDVLG